MKISVCTLLLCLWFNDFYAQTSNEAEKLVKVIMPGAPEAKAFQRYDDIPVDYSTGVPDINFPLYEINTDGINLRIALSYHASGIRVNDVAGCVGLGFNLNAGGRINRTIIDKDDLGTYQPLYFKTPAEYETARNVAYQTSVHAADIKLWDLANKLWEDKIYSDRMSDRYTLFLPNGKSVVFRKNFFTGAFEQIPFENLKIELIDAKFKITDVDGVIYYFDIMDSDGWNLTRIQAPGFNQFLDFTYGAAQGNSFVRPATFVEESGQSIGISYSSSGNAMCFSVATGIGYTNITQSYSDDQQSGGVNNLVTKISNNNIEVLFSYSMGMRYDPGSTQLDEIKVLDKQSLKEIKKIVFNYSNFGNLANKTWRLKLGSFSVLPSGQSSLQNETYRFGYNENVILPPYFDINYHHLYHEDFFGYYNGTSVLRNIPIELCADHSNGNYRYPNPEYTNACTLKEVIYPTGGKTVYELENNYGTVYEFPFTGLNGNIGYAGGLRVKNIKNYSADGNLSNTKTYEYDGGASKSINSNQFCFDKRKVYPLEPTYLGYELYRKVALSEPIETFSIGDNPTVLYNVKEYFGTGNNNIGYTAYYYTYPLRQEQNAYEFPNLSMKHAWQWDYGSERPLLSHKYTYKKNGAIGYSLQLEELYEYTAFKERKFSTGINIIQATTYIGHNYWEECSGLISNAAMSQNATFCLSLAPSPSQMAPTANQFFLNDNIIATETSGYIASHLLTKRTQNLFSNSGLLQTEFNYEYDPITLQLKKEIVKDSKNQVSFIENKYPQDFSIVSPYDEMINRNIISPIIEQTKTNVTLNKELSKSKTNYTFWQNNTLIKPSTIQKSTQGNTLETETTVNDYDDRGNMLQVTSKDGIVTCYFWGYNKEYPVAKIIGTTYDIAKTYITQSVLDNPTDDVALRNHLNNLRNIPNALVTTYTYKPLVGTTSETDPNGKIIFYTYDNFNRLFVITDQKGNILKKICYNYAGQPEDCNANTYTSPVFLSDNISRYITPTITCPAGQIANPVWISLPAGQFNSTISKADANAQAEVLAQQKANEQAVCFNALYARIEYEPESVDDHQASDYVYHNQYVTVWVRFYSDAACTQPYTLTQDIPINASSSGMWWDPSGISYTGNNTSVTALTGTTGVQLETSFPLFGYSDYFDENSELIYFEKWSGSYSINPSTNTFRLAPTDYRGITVPVWY